MPNTNVKHIVWSHLQTHNPKPAKELAMPTHGLTRIKHETLTANISKLGVSGLRKVCTFNKNCSGLIVNWLRNPSLLILANR